MQPPPIKKKSFNWHPETYAAVQKSVAQVRALDRGKLLGMPDAVTGAIQELGSLFCPRPSHDPTGEYRVGLAADGLPEIQKQDESGRWAAV